MPLSVYVLVSFAIMCTTLYLASGDMKDGCTSNFLYVLMGFAVVNMIFSIYMQCRVWGAIVGEDNKQEIEDYNAKISQIPKQEGVMKKAGGMAGGLAANLKAQVGGSTGTTEQQVTPEIPVQEGKIIVPKEVVQSSFKRVFLEDLGVLFMFFLLLGMNFLTFKGKDVLDGDPNACTVSNDTMCANACTVSNDTKNMGYSFFWVAALWCFTYYCCSCCSNKVTLAKENMSDMEAQE